MTTSASASHQRPSSLPLPPRILPDGRLHLINLARSASLDSEIPPSTSWSTLSTPNSTQQSEMFSSSTGNTSPRLDISLLSPPSIATSHSTRSPVFSPMERARRAAPPSHSPPMTIESCPLQYTLHVQLPVVIQPEMVTISANKGNRLKVIADAWHLEDDCHWEWDISFPPNDIDMTGVQAKFEADGNLTIGIRRRPRHFAYA